MTLQETITILQTKERETGKRWEKARREYRAANDTMNAIGEIWDHMCADEEDEEMDREFEKAERDATRLLVEIKTSEKELWQAREQLSGYQYKQKYGQWPWQFVPAYEV